MYIRVYVDVYVCMYGMGCTCIYICPSVNKGIYMCICMYVYILVATEGS